MSKEAMKLALEAAYLAGWNASGEGYNAEYPFGDHARNPEEDASWIKERNNALREALAEQPAQQKPVAWLVECGGDSALVRHTEKFPGIFAGNEFTKRPLVFGDPSLPAQRTWVGLTDGERDAIIGATDLSGTYYYDDLYAVILLAEGKLKEKNA